jgi:hypothetical protein
MQTHWKTCNFGVKEMYYDSCGKSLPPQRKQITRSFVEDNGGGWKSFKVYHTWQKRLNPYCSIF